MGRLRLLFIFSAVFALAVAFTGCKKKDPEYVLKTEFGNESVVHFDKMEDQPKYSRVKKTQFERARALEQHKKDRDKARRLYYNHPAYRDHQRF